MIEVKNRTIRSRHIILKTGKVTIWKKEHLRKWENLMLRK